MAGFVGVDDCACGGLIADRRYQAFRCAGWSVDQAVRSLSAAHLDSLAAPETRYANSTMNSQAPVSWEIVNGFVACPGAIEYSLKLLFC